MTEQQLEQIPWLIREKEYQMRIIEEVQNLAVPGQRSRSVSSFFGTNLNKAGRRVLSNDKELLERAEKLARHVLEERLMQIEELYQFIYQVEDSQMRLILLARFVDRKTWQGVATSIGESDESYVRKKCKRFLKNCQRREETK